MRRPMPLMMLLVLLVVPGVRGGEPLTPAQAAGKVGSTVTVQFQVKGVGTSSEGLGELWSEDTWKNPACFFLRFPKKTMAKLAEQKIPSLGYYQGDIVRATGVVKEAILRAEDGKRAVIYIDDLGQFQPLPPAKPSYTPTADYKQSTVKGRHVFLHPDVVSHPAEMKLALEELEIQLTNIQAVLPRDKLRALRGVRFWLEWDLRGPEQIHSGCAWFQSSAVWLKQRGYNPDRAGDVLISNIKNFVAWSRQDQPWLVLHELAHAHHFLVLGGEHAGIAAAYAQAMERKLYDNVLHANGTHQKAYAATNAAEYYAELSEAFFGQNDFYPFTREQLEKYDPVGHKLMQDTWGVKVPPTLKVARGPTQKKHPAEGKIKSADSGIQTTMKFVNNTKQSVKVFWLDYDGERKPPAVLQPGEENNSNTFLGHVFLVTSEKDDPWYIYVADAQPRTVSIVVPEKK
jgi:hypothetical protein